MSTAVGGAAATTIAFTQIVTFLCNGCITVGLIWTKQYRTGSNILILHLALLDICLSCVTLLATVPSYVQEDWLRAGDQCALVGAVMLLLHAVVLWTICGLNYDKFCAICLPLAYNSAVTRWRTLAALAACWAVAAGGVLVPPLSGALQFRPRAALCLPEFRRSEGALFGAVYAAVMLLTPAAAIVFFNVRILIVARTQRSRIVSAIVSAVTMNARLAVPASGPSTLELQPARARSPGGATVQVLLPLLLMYAPFTAVVVWESLSGRLADGRLVFAAHVLLCLSPLHGLIYGWRSRNLRAVFKNLVRKQLSKSEIQLEIQARAPRSVQQRPSLATQLTMQLPKQLQRRLSDALARDQQRRRRRHSRRHSHHHLKLRRQASELTWAQITQHMQRDNEPMRARSTEAITVDSDCSSGSPMTDRSQTSLTGAAGLAVRAFQLPAAVTGAWHRQLTAEHGSDEQLPLTTGGAAAHLPASGVSRQASMPTRRPLAIPHDEAAARAARSQLVSPETEQLHHQQPWRPQPVTFRLGLDDTLSSQESSSEPRPYGSICSSGSESAVSGAGGVARWLRRQARSSSSDASGSGAEEPVVPEPGDERQDVLELRRTGGLMWPAHNSASVSADGDWQAGGGTSRAQVHRTYSAEPQMV